MVKNLPAMQETWVRSLDWEDPLEKGMATYSIILPWRIPWTEEPCGLQSMVSQRVRYNQPAPKGRGLAASPPVSSPYCSLSTCPTAHGLLGEDLERALK